MSEETDAPQGGTEGVEPTAVETTSEATTEQTTGADEAGLADDAGDAAEEPVKKVPWFQKRINEVTAKVYERDAQVAYWKGLAEGRAATQQAPQASQTVGPPQLDQFDDYDAYETAKVAYLVRENLAAERQQEEQRKEQEKQRAAYTTYQEREAAVRASKPDYDMVARNDDLPVTQTMAQAVWESQLGPEILYHLGSNPQEAARISSLSPVSQAKEIGRIEAALTKAPTAPAKPIPPAPPQTVSGVSAGLKKSMEEMSYTEFKAMRDAEENNRN